MKRTLLEITCGLAVLVLFASFHHQIARLKVQNRDVAQLREMVADAIATRRDDDEITKLRQHVVAHLEGKIKELEVKVAEAAAGSDEARRLKRELDVTRDETATFKTQIARDVHLTRELMDAWHTEMKVREKAAQAGIQRAHTAIESLATRVQPDPRTLTESMLAPTVQLNGDDTVGSGTLVFSDVNTKSGKVESYVVTSFHVVRNILADTSSARREGIAVTIYGDTGKVDVRGDMIAHDEKIDAAMLKLRTDERFPRVARVLPRARLAEVKVWDPIYAVGCPLGNDPIPTHGEVSSTKNELNGSNYWMINAPTYFGNSGGGVYLERTRELIGVFSKIYTHGKGNPVVVPHMGLCTPIDLIYRWLDREQLAFIMDEPRGIEASHEVEPVLDIAPAPGK